MTTLQLRIKFPPEYPVIYKTLRLDSSFTVQEAIASIGHTINVNPSPDIGLYLPDSKKNLPETQLLSTIDNISTVQYLELKSKKAASSSGNKMKCCSIM
ncbi:hypothetical protein SAMD00019534_053020 [Acytostelium subglobosum LB1]|uniref:hypothetical protein n=1 Tax=Acytostelium subglobosum LB1 TaxID=1410327 RepID=UPI000644F401|nr:hypothetical protein SAMD00019534_053020 [Acytostelium subglobosum LB1]GAM22127.1 hypothetical protein SAMD00019534_053020 [Acytostelium subglobosum LB1]|eukprot:XP_012755227.1 hypothetical protein SAMD00019534_053020 [Acytostelium subglobosum LB1]